MKGAFICLVVCVLAGCVPAKQFVKKEAVSEPEDSSDLITMFVYPQTRSAGVKVGEKGYLVEFAIDAEALNSPIKYKD